MVKCSFIVHSIQWINELWTYIMNVNILLMCYMNTGLKIYFYGYCFCSPLDILTFVVGYNNIKIMIILVIYRMYNNNLWNDLLEETLFEQFWCIQLKPLTTSCRTCQLYWLISKFPAVTVFKTSTVVITIGFYDQIKV